MSRVDEEEMEEMFCANYFDFERDFESLMTGQRAISREKASIICKKKGCSVVVLSDAFSLQLWL